MIAKVEVDMRTCIGCGTCWVTCPQTFREVESGDAYKAAATGVLAPEPQLRGAAEGCPSLSIALFDAAGKIAGVPLYRLLGAKHRDWCAISFWDHDMSPEKYAVEAQTAVELGYTSIKIKTRPWFDVRETMPLANVDDPEPIHSGEVHVLAALRREAVPVKGEVLMHVGGETSADANHRAWQKLLKRNTRGQAVEIGGLV